MFFKGRIAVYPEKYKKSIRCALWAKQVKASDTYTYH
jgi:hypothetical protein